MAKWEWIISLGVAVSILNAPLSARERPSHYTVTLPKEVPLEKVQMFYHVKRVPDGIFVIPREDRLKSEEVHGFVFPTKAGDSFEAVFYCPGYQFATIYDPSVTQGEHQVDLSFQPLPALELKGKCPMRSAPEFAGLKYAVEICYHGYVGMTHLRGDHDFPFQIAEVALSADGTFTAEIPDFYHDPLSAKDAFRGLDFQVHSTRPSPSVGYVSYGLAPKGSADFNFKIEADYHGRRDFIEHSGPPLD